MKEDPPHTLVFISLFVHNYVVTPKKESDLINIIYMGTLSLCHHAKALFSTA